jgi:hypothetical protein
MHLERLQILCFEGVATMSSERHMAGVSSRLLADVES